MFGRNFRKSVRRIASLAIIVAVVASTITMSVVPSARVNLSIEGFLSLEATVGVSVAEAASITTLDYHSGFEFGDFSEWDTLTGSPAIEETIVKTGDYSMRTNTTGSTSWVESRVLVADRVSFYLYIVDAPDDDIIICIARFQNPATTTYKLYLTTDRYIDLYLTTAIHEGTTQLDLNTWHRISYSNNGVGKQVRYFINGVEEDTYTDADVITNSGTFAPQIGVRSSATADLYFDNFVQDDTESLDDLGDIRVLRAMPNATGQYAQFDVTSGYTYVDDFPISDATYVEDNGGGAARESYNIEGTADIGIGASDDIHAVNVWIRGEADGGGGTDHMTMVRDNGSDFNSPDHAFNGLAWFSWYHNDLPNGGAAWTVARFDALQIGAYHSGGQDQRVMSVLAMVAYTPSGAEADISNSPSSIAFGTVSTSTTYWSDGAEPSWPLVDADAYFTLTNNGGTCSVTISATNFTGGVGWTLGTPASNVVRLTVFEEGDGSGDGLVLTTSAQAFIAGLTTNVDWELKMETPTIVTDGVGKSSTITLTATLD